MVDFDPSDAKKNKQRQKHIKAFQFIANMIHSGLSDTQQLMFNLEISMCIQKKPTKMEKFTRTFEVHFENGVALMKLSKCPTMPWGKKFPLKDLFVMSPHLLYAMTVVNHRSSVLRHDVEAFGPDSVSDGGLLDPSLASTFIEHMRIVVSSFKFFVANSGVVERTPFVIDYNEKEIKSDNYKDLLTIWTVEGSSKGRKKAGTKEHASKKEKASPSNQPTLESVIKSDSASTSFSKPVGTVVKSASPIKRHIEDDTKSIKKSKLDITSSSSSSSISPVVNTPTSASDSKPVKKSKFRTALAKSRKNVPKEASIAKSSMNKVILDTGSSLKKADIAPALDTSVPEPIPVYSYDGVFGGSVASAQLEEVKDHDQLKSMLCNIMASDVDAVKDILHKRLDDMVESSDDELLEEEDDETDVMNNTTDNDSMFFLDNICLAPTLPPTPEPVVIEETPDMTDAELVKYINTDEIARLMTPVPVCDDKLKIESMEHILSSYREEIMNLQFGSMFMFNLCNQTRQIAESSLVKNTTMNSAEKNVLINQLNEVQKIMASNATTSVMSIEKASFIA